ncbi:sporulation protein [Niallia circulans]|uniref:Sporulation protein n=1 Tax=Niallia circulans TaxID=1397 RepID=A0A553SLH3_NIACI|nr:CAP domain-containing protein [Niallia circulans]TRZ37844.1 sporulation protein [Niallia circulans]
MNKKVILSTAAAAALLMSSPLMQKANAASNTTQESTKVVYQSYNLNEDQINALIKQFSGRVDVNKLLSSLEARSGTTANKQTESTKAPEKTTTTAEKTTSTAKQQTNTTSKPQQAATTTQAASSVSAFEKQVVELTNAERAKNGLPALTLDTNLSKVARAKSEDMSKNNYFDHTSPTYGSPFDMMKQFGISYKAAGENIAKGQTTPEQVVKAWMNSEGHRANILSNKFTHIGVGYVANGNYWTQQFIGK